MGGGGGGLVGWGSSSLTALFYISHAFSPFSRLFISQGNACVDDRVQIDAAKYGTLDIFCGDLSRIGRYSLFHPIRAV